MTRNLRTDNHLRHIIITIIIIALIILAVRRFGERVYNIVAWHDFDTGGHFAALETPDLLVADVREFFATLRLALLRRRSDLRNAQCRNLVRVIADIHPVKAGELSCCRVEAGAQPLNLSGPAVGAGFVDAVAQVGDDLGEPWSSLRVDPQAWAPDAGFTELAKIV
jgi:hypothetical protein